MIISGLEHNTVSFFVAERNFTVHIQHILFIQSSAEGQLDCFYNLAIVYSFAANTDVLVCLCYPAF